MPPLVHVSDGGIFMSRIGCVDPMNTTPAKRDAQKPNKTRGLMKKQEELEIFSSEARDVVAQTCMYRRVVSTRIPSLRARS